MLMCNIPQCLFVHVCECDFTSHRHCDFRQLRTHHRSTHCLICWIGGALGDKRPTIVMQDDANCRPVRIMFISGCPQTKVHLAWCLCKQASSLTFALNISPSSPSLPPAVPLKHTHNPSASALKRPCIWPSMNHITVQHTHTYAYWAALKRKISILFEQYQNTGGKAWDVDSLHLSWKRRPVWNRKKKKIRSTSERDFKKERKKEKKTVAGWIKSAVGWIVKMKKIASSERVAQQRMWDSNLSRHRKHIILSWLGSKRSLKHLSEREHRCDLHKQQWSLYHKMLLCIQSEGGGYRIRCVDLMHVTHRWQYTHTKDTQSRQETSGAVTM